jgi:hypothetical protein
MWAICATYSTYERAVEAVNAPLGWRSLYEIQIPMYDYEFRVYHRSLERLEHHGGVTSI